MLDDVFYVSPGRHRRRPKLSALWAAIGPPCSTSTGRGINPGAADQASGQLVAGDTGLVHDHDAGQRGPVADRSTTRIAMAVSSGRRNDWLFGFGQ